MQPTKKVKMSDEQTVKQGTDKEEVHKQEVYKQEEADKQEESDKVAAKVEVPSLGIPKPMSEARNKLKSIFKR